MFGSLGVPEMMIIFVLALVLFGPKKLPEIGRTIGKAITEFKKASGDLKTTFEREMQTLEQETQSIKTDVVAGYEPDKYNYDYASSYEPQYDAAYGTETSESTAASQPTESASAPQGAESTVAGTPEGAIAHGSEPPIQPGAADHLQLDREPFKPETQSSPAEHNA
jgi:sec-independent protein translocase protein TatA